MRRIIAVEHPLDTEQPADTLLLDFDHRNRRRIVLTTVAGEALLLDMPRAVHMRGGDIARLDDGRAIAIEAAEEALIEIFADSRALVRIAWHLGNRHLPTQFVTIGDTGRIRIREDHVIRAMAEGLGGRCTDLAAAFDPEGGAYEGPVKHSHDHDHDHDHDHHHHRHRNSDAHSHHHVDK